MTITTFIVDERIPLPARRLDSLVQQFARLSRAQAVRLVHAGGVRVNRRPVRTPQARMEVGDRIELDLADALPSQAPAPKRSRASLKVLFEDECLVVVNKPPALLTVPTRHREPQTVISLLNQRLRQRVAEAAAFCVHRLDRGVSGVLVFAKSLDLAHALRDQFAARKPRRNYLAYVAGFPAAAEGTIRSHLATDENLNRYSTGDETAGQLAITHYRVIEHWPAASPRDGRGVTLLSLRLETGRRNQIRVHLAELGHPVLGDRRYGVEQAAHSAWPFRRIALHAASLGFTHPATGKSLEFHAAPPAEFQFLTEKLNRVRVRKKK